jgi:glutamate--cysteine ligase regulatory subunit
VYTEEALAAVAKALGVNTFDTLILSLPGIVLEKDEKDYNSKDFPVDEKTKQAWVGTWKVPQPRSSCIQLMRQIFESLYGNGRVSNLGISEFGMIRLAALLPYVSIRPSVDQINLRDCCDVPRDLLEFTKREGIKLMPHMDGDNPLSRELLQQLLRDDLNVSLKIASMRWVVKYTAVAKERGVIENKGYVNLMTALTAVILYRLTWGRRCFSLDVYFVF